MVEMIQDYFTVAIDCKYEEAKTKSGIILINTAYIDDEDMDRYEHKRLYGTVLAVPATYSDQAHRAIDEGMPRYTKFVGHDSIVDKINRGYRNHDHKSYNCSSMDAYEVVTLADIGKRMDVKVGDRLYFTPQTTEQENYLGKHEGKDTYRVIVNDVICVVRGLDENGQWWFSSLIMQGEWVLVKPNMETWEDITTPAGVIKKPHPDKKWLEGEIAYSRHKHLQPGKRIVYMPDADAEIKVEGEKYLFMPAQDVIGELL
jgi:co-chaperonin GroES (HSP10)